MTVKMDFDESAQMLKALAHPTRLHLLNLIREKHPCVRSMEESLGLAQPNISQHLSIMRQAGIVQAEREGNQVCYKIKNPRIARLLELLLD